MKHVYTLLIALLFSSLGFGQLTEDFDSGLSTSYTTGNVTLDSGVWSVVSVYQESSSSSLSGFAARINDDVANASMTTPALNGAGILSFWYRELNSGGGTFAIQTSTDGTNFNTLTTQSYSGTTFTEFTYTINDSSSNLFIRILSDDNPGHLIIDDFEVTAFSSTATISFDSPTSSESETDATFNTSIPVTMVNYSADVTVSVSVNGASTAEAGDYTLNTTSLTFTADGTQNISLDINDDADSDNETVILDLAITSGTADLGTSQHTLTITDDDLPNIVITEIMYNTPGTDDEWIELYNAEPTDIEISGWTIDYNSGTVFTFPASTTLTSGAYVTIALGSNGDGSFNNDNPFTPDYNSLGVANNLVQDTNITNTLGNTSGTLELKNGGSVIDSVAYADSDASSTDGNGPSYEIIDMSLDNSATSSNWQASAFSGGSPGGISSTLWLGTVDNDWNTAGNWSAGLPTIDTDILIPNAGNPVLSNAASCNKMVVEPGASLTVNSEVTLTVADALTLESVSDSYASLILDGAVSGTIFYKRFVNSNTLGNDLIAPPLSPIIWSNFLNTDTNSDNLLDDGNLAPTAYAFGPFDKSASDYVNYTNFDVETLTAGTGYRAATDAGSTLTFTGSVPTGTINKSIEVSGTSFEVWNLIGNPYPSYISLADFLAANNAQFDGSFAGVYGFDGNGADGWTLWNQAFSDMNTGTLIAPGQGFFVASQAIGGTVTFTPSMRRSGSADDFIVGRAASNGNALAQLNMSTDTNVYHTDIYFLEGTTAGLDPGYDSGAFEGATQGVFTHLVENNTGVDLAIQSLPISELADVVVPLVVYADQGVPLSFSLNNAAALADTFVYLEDNATNTWTLLNDSDYNLTPSTALGGAGRFFVHFSATTLSSENETLSGLQIYAPSDTKTIIVHGTIQQDTVLTLFDIQGRQIMAQALDSSSIHNSVPVESLNQGIYIVQLHTNGQNKTQKVVIK